jgi:hypothetical protein
VICSLRYLISQILHSNFSLALSLPSTVKFHFVFPFLQLIDQILAELRVTRRTFKMPKYSAECNVIANIKQEWDKLYEEPRGLEKIGEPRSCRAESLLVEIAQLVALIWRYQDKQETIHWYADPQFKTSSVVSKSTRRDSSLGDGAEL